jgi:hypothetical protein
MFEGLILICAIAMTSAQCTPETAIRTDKIPGTFLSAAACAQAGKNLELDDEIRRLVLAYLRQPPIPMTEFVHVICVEQN